MRCPGQDARYWTGEVAFEVPCPECGAAVELFKDESRGRCRKCGHRFPNPGIDFGCATWCSLAEQCLGIVPDRRLPPGSGEGALAGRLIQAIKDEFQGEPSRIARALAVFQHAKGLAAKEGGDPRVVLAAALLLEAGLPGPGLEATAPGMGPAKARQILGEIGADEATTQHVCRILAGCQGGEEIDTIEFKIVHDADALAGLAASGLAGERGKLETIIRQQLKTETAKERARHAFAPEEPPPGDRDGLRGPAPPDG